MKDWVKEHIEISLIICLAVFLNFANLGQEGFANLYYAAAVKSMLMNFKNFFFVSFDPGGFITIDKPPFGFWLQCLSASVLGYSGLSILLPQALAGTLSVHIIYRLVKRFWDKNTGLLAAIFQAVTPIAVATNRNNTIDSLLVMVLLLAAWALIIAIEKKKTKWLYAAMLLMGIGYNIKTLEAFMVLPAFYLLYLLASTFNLRKKITSLIAATVLLLIVSLSWAAVVDLTPAENRPYVGSSETNSEMALSFGYNGLLHFLGKGIDVPGQGNNTAMPGPGMGIPPADGQPKGSDGIQPAQQPSGFAPPNTRKGNSMFAMETGDPGPFRLFNSQLGGQISWLLPVALLGICTAIKVRNNGKFSANRKLQSILFWSAWLVPQIVFFSVAVDYHRYYLVMMAPAIAALASIGISSLITVYRSGGVKKWLLPAAIALNLAIEGLLLKREGEWGQPFLIATLIIGVLAIALLIIDGLKKETAVRTTRLAVMLSLVALLIGPAAYAATPIEYGGEAILTHAGPDLNPNKVRDGMPNFKAGPRTQNKDKALETFILANTHNEKYILAVSSANDAAQIIIDTGKPVMAIGGFMGFEKIINVENLAQMVEKGQLRYFLVSHQLSMSQPELYNWITTHGKVVNQSLWQDNTSEQNDDHGPDPMGDMSHGNQLYDLKAE